MMIFFSHFNWQHSISKHTV